MKEKAFCSVIFEMLADFRAFSNAVVFLGNKVSPLEAQLCFYLTSWLLTGPNWASSGGRGLTGDAASLQRWGAVAKKRFSLTRHGHGDPVG